MHLKHRLTRAGGLLPVLLASFAFVDVGTRLLVPVQASSIRAWEPMSVGAGPGQPFAPDRSVWRPRAWGDLSNMSGDDELRVYRSERFTSDSWGFRNRLDRERVAGGSPWIGLLTGTSNSVGSGLSDGQTVPEQLGRLLEGRVYSVAGLGPILPGDLKAIIRRLDLKSGVVLVEYFEREGAPHPSCVICPQPRLSRYLKEAKASLASYQGSRIQLPTSCFPRPPMERFSSDSPVRAPSLPDGSRLLLFAGDLEPSSRTTIIPVDYYVDLAQRLAEENLRLIVFLVPTKFSVYQPLLDDPDLPTADGRTLAVLERRLRRAGVEVVNLKPILRTAAAREFPRLLYFADDTHWNSAGAALVAQALATRVRQEH